jgi:hypothetical protein
VVSRLSKFIKTSWFHHNNREGILVKKKKKDDSIWSFLLGIGLGAIGFGILSLFNKPSCPKCHNKIKQGISVCPFCHTELEWKVN